jgi:hypothetical protein
MGESTGHSSLLAQVDECFLSAHHHPLSQAHRAVLLSVAVITGCRAGALMAHVLGSMTALHLAAITSQAYKRAPSPPP